MVGVRADEPHRIAKMRQRGLSIPLVDAGIGKTDVLAFWKAQPFDLALRVNSGITDLGNCDLCFLKGMPQLASIIQHDPKKAIWWAKQEEKIGATFSKDRPSYAEMMKFSSEQTDLFGTGDESIACFCGD